MRFRHVGRMAEIDPAAWDALFDPGYPFTRHQYLLALEETGCATPERGWTPCHLLAEDENGQLVAAAPLYLKAHSWGEFVFDFSWADAAERAGLSYYPKLLTAIPFTPAAGPRLGARDDASRERLRSALSRLPAQTGASSWHGLSLPPEDSGALPSTLLRQDIQFHWSNPGYADFEAFLAALRHDKRKKILQERRKVAALGWQFETLPGDALSEPEWRALYALYSHTYEERGQPPYLTLEFFLQYARAPGTPARVTVARDGRQFMAMAFLVQGADTLYGRHWGCASFQDGLHFETCYYQGIEYCIRTGLSRYDAGAQGEHKLARGFNPVMTYSLHSFAEPRFTSAVAAALERERRQVAHRMDLLAEHRAYRQAET
jgi:predicted N-acyltransferase